MNKSEALQMVIQMLDRGEIEYNNGQGWSNVKGVDTVGTFRVKPFKFAGVEIPQPLSREELEKFHSSKVLYTIALWNNRGVGTVENSTALRNFSDISIVYDTEEKVLQAVEAIRAYESD